MQRAFTPNACAAWLAGVALACFASTTAAASTLRLATTAPMEQSGLFKQLLPQFQKATGINVTVVGGPVATVVELARQDEVDVFVIFDKEEGDKLVAKGRAAKGVPIMSNEFLLVGPKGDPSKTAGKDIADALKKLDATRGLFVSRGDQSLTHAAELRLWALAGITGNKRGSLRECKCGMGTALDIAATAFGYTIADKGTWASFRNRVDLVALVEGDPRLVVTHLVYAVHDKDRPKTDAQKAEHAQRVRDTQKFVQWLTSAPAQAAIAAHKLGGQPYFVPVVAPAAAKK
jgi:tungstate transport system substrate-binding protein